MTRPVLSASAPTQHLQPVGAALSGTSRVNHHHPPQAAPALDDDVEIVYDRHAPLRHAPRVGGGPPPPQQQVVQVPQQSLGQAATTAVQYHQAMAIPGASGLTIATTSPGSSAASQAAFYHHLQRLSPSTDPATLSPVATPTMSISNSKSMKPNCVQLTNNISSSPKGKPEILCLMQVF